MVNTEIALSRGDYPLDAAIALWLHEKITRSNSVKTRRAYADTLASLRALLHQASLDLDGPVREVATIAQGWAALPRPDGRLVAASTHNQRLAIASSFYSFVRKRGLLQLSTNPIEGIARRPVQSYASARPLDAGTVQRRMKAIDRGTLRGKRDYALLAIALQTGRRLSEVTGLRWGDVEHLDAEHSGQQVTLTFQAKGDKVLRDTLTRPVSRALLDYLLTIYPNGASSPEAPLWVELHSQRRAALSVRSVSNICQRRLGTSKVHALRHTFARSMEQVGAKVSDIQARLGHANLATTGRYLAALQSAENAHAEQLAALLGLG